MPDDDKPKESLADIASGFAIKGQPDDPPDSETKGWDDDERSGNSKFAEMKRSLRAFVMGNVGNHGG